MEVSLQTASSILFLKKEMIVRLLKVQNGKNEGSSLEKINFMVELAESQNKGMT
ncbi:hypothetical protein ACYSNR_16600 [Enterococcus sp. LJL128]